MSSSEEYLSSFTFSIFLEDISSELQLRRRNSEHVNISPKLKSSRLSTSTNDSFDMIEPKTNCFKLSKFCPHFESYTPFIIRAATKNILTGNIIKEIVTDDVLVEASVVNNPTEEYKGDIFLFKLDLGLYQII